MITERLYCTGLVARLRSHQRRYIGRTQATRPVRVLVLAFAAATAGGIARDALLGAVPQPRSWTGAILRCRSLLD